MSREESRMAIEAGASALGLVSAMPGGPGIISDEQIAHIASAIPPGIASFLLTSLTESRDIVRQHQLTRTSTIQFVDQLEKGAHRNIREHLPGIRLVQVIHVRNEEAVDEALKISEDVDAILLDSGNPDFPVRELGGTGRVHNWNISRRIRELSGKPVWLAGGLNPQNVADAIGAVQPFGIDICSGVRTDGKLDSKKLKDLFDVLDKM